MTVRLSLGRIVTGALFVALLLSGQQPSALLAQDESSPISVELIAPPQAGPGTIFEVLINYDAVDINAGADLNYNVFGPCHVFTRDPEPPNPAFNTWLPTEESAKGTIKIQIQVHEGSDGQTIRHQVEVRWGSKAHKFESRTLVQYVPPTSTPTPRPRATQPAPTPVPTQPAPAQAILSLSDVSLVGLEGQPVLTAEANQEISLQATYASTGELADVDIVIRFEPDVVNLEGLQRVGGGYVLEKPSLPAAPEGAPLFDPPPRGRIRSYADGGDGYALRAVVGLLPAEGTTEGVPEEAVSAPIQVTQVLSLRVGASTEADLIRAGGNVIVHASCENLGAVPVRGVRLRISDLPEGFSVSPEEQMVDEVAADGAVEKRLFTIRTPEGFSGTLTFNLVAATSDTVFESAPLTVGISVPLPLSLQASASAATVYAGEAVYINVSASNEGRVVAQGVTARLIDVTGNLGVLVQDVGDIGPGESREWVFVVEIPDDFPADVVSSLAVQTVSEDGVTSRTSPISVTVVCRPRFEVFIEPLAGRLQGGQSLEAIVLLKNVGQCAARDVSLSLEGLPGAFTQPPEQQVIELTPGGTRYVTFNILIPQGYQGTASFAVIASDSVGSQTQSSPTSFTVGGVSVVFTVVFGFLAVVAVAAVVAGVILYFRQR